MRSRKQARDCCKRRTAGASRTDAANAASDAQLWFLHTVELLLRISVRRELQVQNVFGKIYQILLLPPGPRIDHPNRSLKGGQVYVQSHLLSTATA